MFVDLLEVKKDDFKTVLTYTQIEKVSLLKAKEICDDYDGELSHCTSAQNEKLNPEIMKNHWCAWYWGPNPESVDGEDAWRDDYGTLMEDTDAQFPDDADENKRPVACFERGE